MERQNINYLLCVGPEEDDQFLNDEKAQMALLAGEERNEGESVRGQPGSGAAAAEGKGAELSGEGPSTCGSAGLVANWSQEDQGASGIGQESDKQPEEPVRGRESVRGSENVSPGPSRWTCTHPVRVLVPECRANRRYRFTLLQLQELEGAFQRSHYLTTAETRRLARSIGVSEARVQKWFRKRREQYRNYKRL
ncbi:rhox homeobox family member 2-like [Acomys russatus]|uniref:rhox homeobox family member 2-like n=1 Tax=Acomys russatus TaxID=60746 RepID=UPI0021E23159|nr:rhox homeobox family member 2-like [Acomys russatus]